MTNFLRYKPGELKRRAQQSTLLGDVVFDPDAGDLTDVEIITLKQHARDEATADACAMMSTHSPSLIEHYVDELLTIKWNTAKEFVRVTPEKITVGVNTNIVDDAAVDRALMLMIQVDDITQEQFTEFGEDILLYGS